MGYDTSLLLLLYAAIACTAAAHTAAFGSSRTTRVLLQVAVAAALAVIFGLLGDWDVFSSRASAANIFWALAGPAAIAAGPPRVVTSRLGRMWGLVTLIWIGFLLFSDLGHRLAWVAVVGPAADLAGSGLAVLWLMAVGHPGAAHQRAAWKESQVTAGGLSVFICVAAAVALLSEQNFGLPPLLAILAFASAGCASAVLWRAYVRAMLYVDQPPRRAARCWLAVAFVVLVSGGALLVLPTVLAAGKRLRPTATATLPNERLTAPVSQELQSVSTSLSGI